MASKTTTLQSRCIVHSNETGVTIKLPTEINGKIHGWNALSSATYNGGLRSLPTNGCGVINIKVPPTYDGIDPPPHQLIRQAIQNAEGNLAEDATIGMMTAAHMKTLRTSTRYSGRVVLDVVVTAGISNARAAGADADCFLLQKERKEHPAPGTINTVLVINTPLSESALVEAYAIAVEAKCAACSELNVMCTKSGKNAQGTGTDCLVLICPTFSCANGNKDLNADDTDAIPNAIEYAGKHMLLGEFIGQAVKEATHEAIVCNICELYGSIWRYRFHQSMKRIANLIRCGAQPCVPPFPMMPVPSAPTEVLVLGVTLTVVAYISGLFLPRKATIILAATAWDRCVTIFNLNPFICQLTPANSTHLIQMSSICSTCDPSCSSCGAND